MLYKYFNSFLRAVLAGLCIGFGGVVYLSCTSKLAGAIFFSIGLLTILIFKLKLFTGACGLLIEADKKLRYSIELILIWIGNFLGTFLVALAVTNTRLSFDLSFVDTKLTDSFSSLLILGIGCGFLMYVGVTAFNLTNLGPIIPIMCVSVFILSGFEHCVADMFYFSLLELSVDVLLRLLVITAGNMLGSWLIPITNQILKVGGNTNAK